MTPPSPHYHLPAFLGSLICRLESWVWVGVQIYPVSITYTPTVGKPLFEALSSSWGDLQTQVRRH